MKMFRSPFVFITALIAFTTSSIAADAPSSMPNRPHDADYWQNLDSRLNDENSRTRDSAQLDLAQISIAERAAIADLVKTTAEENKKTSLEDLQAQLALNPPLLSVDFKDATIGDVTKKLSIETRAKIRSAPILERDPRRFTLHAGPVSFWEIITALAQQQPTLTLVGHNAYTLTFSDRPFQTDATLLTSARSGPFAIFPSDVTQSIQLQHTPEQKTPLHRLTISYVLAADPRISVFEEPLVDVKSITDDVGNSLQCTAISSRRLNPSAAIWGGSFTIYTPPNVGAKITSAKGTITITGGILNDPVEISQPKPGTTVTIGTQKITCREFKESGGIIRFAFDPEGFDPNAMLRPAPEELPPAPTWACTVIDADGQFVTSTTMDVRTGLINLFGPFKNPVTLRFAALKKTKAFSFNFELKDIPLR